MDEKKKCGTCGHYEKCLWETTGSVPKRPGAERGCATDFSDCRFDPSEWTPIQEEQPNGMQKKARL